MKLCKYSLTLSAVINELDFTLSSLIHLELIFAYNMQLMFPTRESTLL